MSLTAKHFLQNMHQKLCSHWESDVCPLNQTPALTSRAAGEGKDPLGHIWGWEQMDVFGTTNIVRLDKQHTNYFTKMFCILLKTIQIVEKKVSISQKQWFHMLEYFHHITHSNIHVMFSIRLNPILIAPISFPGLRKHLLTWQMDRGPLSQRLLCLHYCHQAGLLSDLYHRALSIWYPTSCCVYGTT